jgi:LPS O-antigen subunit length determinant protein (WzzB/FepE family)
VNIIKYLESNPYIKKEIALEKESLNEGIGFLSQELGEISKLKANISAIGEKGNTNNTSFDLEDIYRQSMELFERKLQLEHELKTIENFQVIQGFTAYQKPVSPKFSLSLAGGFVAGLILAFLFIFFKEFGKHLKTLEERGE